MVSRDTGNRKLFPLLFAGMGCWRWRRNWFSEHKNLSSSPAVAEPMHSKNEELEEKQKAGWMQETRPLRVPPRHSLLDKAFLGKTH